MLEITLTREGFSANQVISDDLLNSGSPVKVICKQLYKGSEASLMDEVCEYINSSNRSGTKVRPNIVYKKNDGTNNAGYYIKELTFQIIF